MVYQSKEIDIKEMTGNDEDWDEYLSKASK